MIRCQRTTLSRATDAGVGDLGWAIQQTCDLWETTLHAHGLAQGGELQQVHCGNLAASGGSSCLGAQILLRLGHQLDMQFVARLRIIREGEQTVLQQHQAINAFRAQIAAFDQIVDRLGQDEARHHIRHDDDT